MVQTERNMDEPAAGPPATTAIVLFSPDARIAGATYVLSPGFTVGRVGGADLQLAADDARMSRRHARLGLSSSGARVEDLGSTNGTWVEGRRITGPVDLVPGQVIRTGNTLLEIGPSGESATGASPRGARALVGRAPAFVEAVRALERVAPSDLPVVLRGETGTGKEVFAAHLHEASGRPGAFVAVNCAAIPRELLESTLFGHRRGAFTGATADVEGQLAQADRGTLFLDEIGDLPLELQAKLLRVLESGEYTPIGQAAPRRTDARLVAATNADLGEKLAAGTFRRDLYARLAGLVLELPPLRRRRRDIAPLCEHFLAAAGRTVQLGADFLEPLLLAPWPMNVRELRMAMRRLALFVEDGEALGAGHARTALDASPPHAPAPPAALDGDGDGGAGDDGGQPGADAPTREALEAILAEHRGNVARVAAHYGKDRRQAYRWLKRYGIDPGSFR